MSIQNKLNELKDYLKSLKKVCVAYSGGLDSSFLLKVSYDVLKEKNIREVIAFPKTGDSRDLMMEIPDFVSKEQLDELHLEIKKDKIEKK